MSSYVRRAMQPDEKVAYAAQLHWIIYKSGIIFTILAALFAFYANGFIADFLGEETAEMAHAFVKNISIGLLVVGGLLLVFAFIRQISTELVVTDQRVIAKHGFIATTSYELMMTKVEGATIDQSIMGRMLGYGTLMVKGTGGGISPIDHVADPYKFHAKLMTALREAHENDAHSHHD